MDNLDKIKFKEAGNNWFVKIFLDENGNEESRTPSFTNGKGSGSGLYKEMQAYVAAGNKIEPQFTAEELGQKEIDDLQNALDSQKAICIQLLNDSEKAVSNDPPYPNDIAKWKTFRGKLRTILKSDAIVTIPNKPF